MRKLFLLTIGILLSCNLMAEENSIIDTTKAQQLIIRFYRAELTDTIHSQATEDSILACLTPPMYDKLRRINNTCDCSSVIRAQAISGYELKTLHCHYLKDNWFMVSFQRSEQEKPEQIPVRVGSAPNGQLKISYIVPEWGGDKYGDKMFDIADVKVKDDKTALAMVTTFFRKYARTYALMPETLHDDLVALRKAYCTNAMLDKFNDERSDNDYEGWTGYDAIVLGYDFDALWYPQLKFLPVNPSEVIVMFNNRTLRVKTDKENGHYKINDVIEVDAKQSASLSFF